MKLRVAHQRVWFVKGSHGVQPPAGNLHHGSEEQAAAPAPHFWALLPVYSHVWPGGPSGSDRPRTISGLRHSEGYSHLTGQSKAASSHKITHNGCIFWNLISFVCLTLNLLLFCWSRKQHSERWCKPPWWETDSMDPWWSSTEYRYIRNACIWISLS